VARANFVNPGDRATRDFVDAKSEFARRDVRLGSSFPFTASVTGIIARYGNLEAIARA